MNKSTANTSKTFGNRDKDGRHDKVACLKDRLDVVTGHIDTMDAHEASQVLRACMDEFADDIRRSGATHAVRVEALIEGTMAYAIASFEIWLALDGDPAADEVLCAHDAGIGRTLAEVARVTCRGYALTADERPSVDGLARSIDRLNRYPHVKVAFAQALDEESFDIVTNTSRIPYGSVDELLCAGSSQEICGAAVMIAMSGRHVLACELFEGALERCTEDAVAGAYATLLQRVHEVGSVAAISHFSDIVGALERLLAQPMGKDVGDRWRELTRFGSYAAHLLGEVEGHLRDALNGERLRGTLAGRAMAQLADVEATKARVSVLIAGGLAEVMDLGPSFVSYIEYRAWKRCLERVPQELRDETWWRTWHALRQGFERQVMAARSEAERLTVRVQELEGAIVRAHGLGIEPQELEVLEEALSTARFDLICTAASFDVCEWDELG